MLTLHHSVLHPQHFPKHFLVRHLGFITIRLLGLRCKLTWTTRFSERIRGCRRDLGDSLADRVSLEVLRLVSFGDLQSNCWNFASDTSFLAFLGNQFLKRSVFLVCRVVSIRFRSEFLFTELELESGTRK